MVKISLAHCQKAQVDVKKTTWITISFIVVVQFLLYCEQPMVDLQEVILRKSPPPQGRGEEI